ncbi:hypothetical protein CsSME_00038552 [Camellia sinensis var. sinensis]
MAYIMETNEEKRVKGKTIDVGRPHFETETSRFTILDAPVGYPLPCKKNIDHISFANFGYFKGPTEASVDAVMFLAI